MVEKNSKEMAKIAVAALEEKKAKDIKILDISGVSVLADQLIIASGSNRNQVQAMADEAQEKLYKAGYEAKQVEGCLLYTSTGGAGAGKTHIACALCITAMHQNRTVKYIRANTLLKESDHARQEGNYFERCV